MISDFNITAEIPTTSESPTTTQPPTTTSIGSPAAASTLIPIIATLACVIILLLLVVIVCGTLVMITKKVIRKHRIKDTNGQVKYISSEGGYLATEDGSRGICGFDNRVVSFSIFYSLNIIIILKFQYSNNGTSDPEYDSIDDTGISAESDKNVKSTVGHDTQSEPQESESLSNDFRNRMVCNIKGLSSRVCGLINP